MKDGRAACELMEELNHPAVGLIMTQGMSYFMGVSVRKRMLKIVFPGLSIFTSKIKGEGTRYGIFLLWEKEI